MNREYKFRGKRIDNGEWIYGSLLDGDIIVSGPVDVDEEYIGLGEWSSVSHETVGEYTGLKDKNGKEIYEGDIVNWNNIKYKICIGEFGVRNFETEEVLDMAFGVYGSAINEEMEPFCHDMQMNSTWIKYHGIEIIGNVHSTPNLLEDTKHYPKEGDTKWM